MGLILTKMSHAKRGDATHNGVMPISMTQLILGTEDAAGPPVLTWQLMFTWK